MGHPLPPPPPPWVLLLLRLRASPRVPHAAARAARCRPPRPRRPAVAQGDRVARELRVRRGAHAARMFSCGCGTRRLVLRALRGVPGALPGVRAVRGGGAAERGWRRGERRRLKGRLSGERRACARVLLDCTRAVRAGRACVVRLCDAGDGCRLRGARQRPVRGRPLGPIGDRRALGRDGTCGGRAGA